MVSEPSFTDGLKALGNEIKATAYMDAACDCMVAAEAYQTVGNEQAKKAAIALSHQLRAKANALSSTVKPEAL